MTNFRASGIMEIVCVTWPGVFEAVTWSCGVALTMLELDGKSPAAVVGPISALAVDQLRGNDHSGPK